MPLKAPNLDDRDFHSLVADSLRRVQENCPDWTDLSPHDPGVVLLELFAFLTETMIYRLNRLPEKAYIEFLRILGVNLNPPTAASVRLRFSLAKAQKTAVEIARGTRVTLNRTSGDSAAPIFTTLETIVLPPGQTEIEAMAYNCELVEAEPVGHGTGLAGLSLAALRPPVVARTSDELEFILGVETAPDELTERPRTIEHAGKIYRIWEEVGNFSNLGGRQYVYLVDRVTGTITFAPAVQGTADDGTLEFTPTPLGAKPAEGREIRLWYCRGGGADGNIAANNLTVLKTPLAAGVTVTNPQAATGGRNVETLENAILRAPQEFHSLERAVTANDFELLALRSSGAVIRAKAFTKAALWRHAAPGTIEVLLVPNVPEEVKSGDKISLEDLQNQATDEARADVRLALNERRPLGTTCLVNWVRYKKVSVRARAVTHRGADPESAKNRILKRLYQSINPLPSKVSSGWSFGRPLRASHIYDIILAEKDVAYVEGISLHVDEVPELNLNRNSLAVDAFQPNTWYAATGANLFRSTDDGDGWELIGDFAGEEILSVQANRNKAGLLAVATKLADNSSKLYVSADCGETWRVAAVMNFIINETAWSVRDGSVNLLLLATDEGLYELLLQSEATPVQVLVDESNPKLGFYAVTTSVGARGTYYVAVAARSTGGVFLSTAGGKSKTFSKLGLAGEDVRVLEMQQDGVRTFLWAGISVAGNEAGKGCVRWELQGGAAPTGATNFSNGWEGGSCHGIAFGSSYAFAATHEKGVLWLDLGKGEAAVWQKPILESGLPIRDVERIFQPTYAVAANAATGKLLAGGTRGVYRSADNGASYGKSSEKDFRDKVTLPETWLFVSGEHEIEVAAENEKRGS